MKSEPNGGDLRSYQRRGQETRPERERVPPQTAEGGHPTLRAERESLSLLHILRAHDKPQSEWLNAITSDPTLSAPVRQRALPFAREWQP